MKTAKKVSEEVEQLEEGRPSQQHPLEGHEYHKKSDAELEYIAKDAHEAAEAMKSHGTESGRRAENKYRDQASDSATVRYFRKKSGMPDWYKKKYGHVKEEVELETVSEGYILKKINVSSHVKPGDRDDHTPDIKVKNTDYNIIHNKTGQAVGKASWTTDDYFGPRAVGITMKNGAKRNLDISNREKGNPQTAFNRFIKDPKTSKKYKEHGVAEAAGDARRRMLGNDEYARKVDKYLKKKHGKDDSQKKLPMGADFAAERRKERLAKNGRMDEASKTRNPTRDFLRKNPVNSDEMAKPVSRKAQIVRSAAKKDKFIDDPIISNTNVKADGDQR
jgi:hypothetical protein